MSGLDNSEVANILGVKDEKLFGINLDSKAGFCVVDLQAGVLFGSVRGVFNLFFGSRYSVC